MQEIRTKTYSKTDYGAGRAPCSRPAPDHTQNRCMPRPPRLTRARRVARLSVLLTVAWVSMVLTHECGHLLGGALGGAVLVDLDLTPGRLPWSLHSPDPHPLLTLWAGPITGALAPCVVAMLVRRDAAWFVANFCLLANGVYLALGWIAGDRFLDTARLLEAGAHPISILLFCAATIGAGYPRFRADCIGLWSSAEGEPPAGG